MILLAGVAVGAYLLLMAIVFVWLTAARVRPTRGQQSPARAPTPARQLHAVHPCRDDGGDVVGPC